MQEYPSTVGDPLELVGSSLREASQIPSTLWQSLVDRYTNVQAQNQAGYDQSAIADVGNPEGVINRGLGQQIPQGYEQTLADVSTTGTPTATQLSPFVGPPIPESLLQRGQIDTSAPMSAATRGATQKQNNTLFQNKDELQKKMAEYQRKREELAIDAQARMDKLQTQYDGQGPSFAGLSMVADAANRGGRSNLAQYNQTDYARNMMSPQKLEALKQGINQQLQTNYSSMTNTLYNQKTQEDNLKFKREAAILKASGDSRKDAPWEVIKGKTYLNLMNTGLEDLSSIINGPDYNSALTKGAIVTGLGSTKASFAIKMFNHGIGRLTSGAAIGDKEKAEFNTLVINATDSVEDMNYKIRKMRELTNRTMNDLTKTYAIDGFAKKEDYSTASEADVIAAYNKKHGIK